MVTSINCSYGNLVVWEKIVNCALDRDHQTGQVLGVLAVALWSSAHICQYLILRSRVKSASSTRIMTFLFTHWLSECMSVVSAFLAQQWMSQIIYSLCIVLLLTVCCLHYMVAPLPSQTNIVAIDKKLTVRSRSRFKSCPHVLSLLFFPAVILTITRQYTFLNNTNLRAINHPSQHETDFLIPHTVGYVFGSLAGVLYCCIVMIDMLDSILIWCAVLYFIKQLTDRLPRQLYTNRKFQLDIKRCNFAKFMYITVESSVSLFVTYIIRILSECVYVSSVFVQNKTIFDHIRTSPWSIPRLVSIGLNIGILIQRSVQKKKGKRRKLSREDTECLLSSESETEFLSDDSEEEVIWMPLKSVQSAIPTHPVCVSRVQIISEADIPPDVTSPDDIPPDFDDCSSHEDESILNGPEQTKTDETSAVTDEDNDN